MQTTPGLMVSLVVYALVISFMSISITRFVNGQPSTSQWSRPVTNATEQVLVVGWKFPKIADPRYFRVQLLYRTRTFNESTQKGKTVPVEVPSTKDCPGIENSGGNDTICYQTPPILRGYCFTKDCNSVRMFLDACDNVTAAAKGVVCKPKEDILALFANNPSLSVYVNTSRDREPVLLSNSYVLSSKFSVLYLFLMTIRRVSYLPNFFTTWREVAYDELLQEPVESDLQDVFLDSHTAWPRRFSAMGFMLSAQENFLEHIPQTFPDLIGSWSAFGSALVMIFGFGVRGYVENLFYRRNPGWSNFNERFRHEHESIYRTRKRLESLGIALLDARGIEMAAAGGKVSSNSKSNFSPDDPQDTPTSAMFHEDVDAQHGDGNSEYKPVSIPA